MDGLQRGGEDEDSNEATIDDRTLLSRALGLPGCDFQEEPHMDSVASTASTKKGTDELRLLVQTVCAAAALDQENRAKLQRALEILNEGDAVTNHAIAESAAPHRGMDGPVGLQSQRTRNSALNSIALGEVPFEDGYSPTRPLADKEIEQLQQEGMSSDMDCCVTEPEASDQKEVSEANSSCVDTVTTVGYAVSCTADSSTQRDPHHISCNCKNQELVVDRLGIEWLKENPICDKEEVQQLRGLVANLKDRVTTVQSPHSRVSVSESLAEDKKYSSNVNVRKKEGREASKRRSAIEQGGNSIAELERNEGQRNGECSRASGGSQDEALEPKVLLARALGLPGCDFQASPFTDYNKCIPTRKDLLLEARRRFQILGIDKSGNNRSLLPTTNSTKPVFISWLTENPIPSDRPEAAGLQAQVEHLRAKLQSGNGRCSTKGDKDQNDRKGNGIAVHKLRPIDVVIERGGLAEKHPGNVAYFRAVEDLSPNFQTGSTDERARLVQRVFDKLTVAENRRFLTREKKCENCADRNKKWLARGQLSCFCIWNKVDDAAAKKKIYQMSDGQSYSRCPRHQER